jgi:predicted DNA-binding ribbon-helix-helix protein
VTLQLDEMARERAREVSTLQADLESEKEARRGWQDIASSLRVTRLNAVTLQLDERARGRAREVSTLQADLESEKEARRRWQDKASSLRERLSEMVICLLTGHNFYDHH